MTELDRQLIWHVTHDDYGMPHEVFESADDVLAARDAAVAALQRMYDHVHEGCDTAFSNPCNLPLGDMHNPCWCRQARQALTPASSRTENE